jgi:hypothetical protein
VKASLAPDRMTDVQLWKRLENRLLAIKLMCAGYDGRWEVRMAAEQAEACAAEIRMRGQQLTLLPGGGEEDCATERGIYSNDRGERARAQLHADLGA